MPNQGDDGLDSGPKQRSHELIAAATTHRGPDVSGAEPMRNRPLISLLAMTAFASPAFAQADICGMFLTNPIFTKENYDSTLKTDDSFKQLQCSASWRSASEAQAAGISGKVPIYGLVVPFTANWDQNKVEQWKNSNCSAAERSGFYEETLHKSALKISPTSAEAALECAKAQVDARALRCSVTEGDGTIIFEAEWRRTAGEAADAAPQIQSMTISSATCLNVADMAAGGTVKEGGTSLLCKRGDDAPLFSINTNRGQCFGYGMSKKDAIELDKTIILDHPTTYKGSSIVLKPDLKLVTQGYPLQIIADDRLEIQGSPQILSYLPTTKNTMEPGRSAQSVSIKARRLQGAGLSINNAGENGGQGAQGQPGSTGPQGAPGQGRDPVTGSSGGFFGKVVEAIPKSCTGGKNGDTGGKGGTGLQGVQGAPGGAAGIVTLSLPPDADESVILVRTNVGLDSAPRSCDDRICGGQGGGGGPGGPGGPGGAGGPGAHGTTWCGGTSDGSQGAQGEVGQPGGKGDDGPTAEVRRN